MFILIRSPIRAAVTILRDQIGLRWYHCGNRIIRTQMLIIDARNQTKKNHIQNFGFLIKNYSIKSLDIISCFLDRSCTTRREKTVDATWQDQMQLEILFRRQLRGLFAVNSESSFAAPSALVGPPPDADFSTRRPPPPARPGVPKRKPPPDVDSCPPKTKPVERGAGTRAAVGTSGTESCNSMNFSARNSIDFPFFFSRS